MPLDRSPIRESGSSDRSRPRVAGDFDGHTTRQAMKDLLAKHDTLDQNPAHRFWKKQQTHTISGRHVMTQREHGARVWERLFPGKSAHFEVDGAAIERRFFLHYAPRTLRTWFTRAFRIAVVLLASTALHAQSRQETAAATMARLDSPANFTAPRPVAGDGPFFVILPSQEAYAFRVFDPRAYRAAPRRTSHGAAPGIRLGDLRAVAPAHRRR